MASVYQKRGTWYVDFKDVVGHKQLATKATSKTEARKIAQELERKAERQRLGLEAMPADEGETLGSLCEWWLEERCPKASAKKEKSRLSKWVLTQPIAQVPLLAVTPARLEEHLRATEKAGLAPNSCNRLRAILRCVYSRAIKADKWTGANPLDRVERRKTTKRLYQILAAEEVPLVLAKVGAKWRDLMATAIWTGMRKGELLGLRKASVDFTERRIIVERSYDRDTTKGGHSDAIPIADPLVPYLKHAVESAKGELVFPDERGRMRSVDTKLEEVLRRAIGKAGLVDGYDHVCRRCKGRKAAEHTWRHKDAVERRCPNCDMRLWPKAIPRHLRFHDLRHTAGTLMTRAGAAPRQVQRVLRHSDLRTSDIYTHLDVTDLRAAVNSIAPAAGAAPFPTRLLPAPTGTTKAANQGAEKLPESAALQDCAWQESNLRPSDSKDSQPRCQALSWCSKPSEITGESKRQLSKPSPRIAGNQSQFPTRFLPEIGRELTAACAEWSYLADPDALRRRLERVLQLLDDGQALQQRGGSR